MSHSSGDVDDVAVLRRRDGAGGRASKVGRAGAVLVLAVLAGGAFYAFHRGGGAAPAAMAAMPPAPVTVSTPLVRELPSYATFLGQFSAVDSVELRAQVGGTLTEIDFKDGQIVHKGDPLFVIDPRPYQIRLDEAHAQIATAAARLGLAGSELWRAQQLKQTDFGTAENVDQRSSEQRSASAALEQAQAALRDANLDLEYSRISAPFDGKMGNHQVSIGNLVSGSRGGTSPTTLLATIVSLDPIHLDFNMSENDYIAFARARGDVQGPLAVPVEISVGDDDRYDRKGTLDFIDNVVDRASGTIHARATVPNADLFLVPGEFARVRIVMKPPAPRLLAPDAAIVPDQSQHMVMTVAPDGTVVPKIVQIGDLHGGLRVIQSGITRDDRIIVNGLMHAMPGMKVAPQPGKITFDADEDAQR